MRSTPVRSLGFAHWTALLTLTLFGAGLAAWLERGTARPPSPLPPPLLSEAPVVVYGPRTFTTPSGSRQYFVERFGVGGEARAYTLVLDNGAPNGTQRASEASVRVNGHVVIARAQVNGSVARLERSVDLLPEDTLQVDVKGGAGAFVTLTIQGVPDPTFTLFGPERVIQVNSRETQVTRTFTRPTDAAVPYVLHLVNGRADGTGRVDGARVTLNGTTLIIGPTQDDDDDEESCDSSDDDEGEDDDDDDGDDGDDEDDDGGGSIQRLRLCRNIGALWRTVSLQATNTITVTVRGPTGSEVTVWITARDVTPPVLTITTPAPNALTNQAEIAVTGTVTDRTATVVTVNDVVAIRNGEAYSATVPLPAEGANVLTVVATDAAGLHTDSTRTVIMDSHAPVLTVTAPLDGLITKLTPQTVSGTVFDASPVMVKVNEIPLPVDGAGVFTGQIPLAEGANALSITATDAATNAVTAVRIVTLDRLAPVIVWAQPTDGASIAADAVTVTGTVTDSTAVTVTANGLALMVTGPGPERAFSGAVSLVPGPNTITLVATDAATNVASQSAVAHW